MMEDQMNPLSVPAECLVIIYMHGSDDLGGVHVWGLMSHLEVLRRSVSVDIDTNNIPGRALAAHLENIHRAALAEAHIPTPAEQLALILAEKRTKRQACRLCNHARASALEGFAAQGKGSQGGSQNGCAGCQLDQGSEAR